MLDNVNYTDHDLDKQIATIISNIYGDVCAGHYKTIHLINVDLTKESVLGFLNVVNLIKVIYKIPVIVHMGFRGRRNVRHIFASTDIKFSLARRSHDIKSYTINVGHLLTPDYPMTAVLAAIYTRFYKSND